MQIKPNELRCNAEELKQIVSILRKIKSGLVRVEARNNTLNLLIRHTHDKWNNEIENPCYALIRVHYLGKDFSPVFVDIKSLPEKWEEKPSPGWEKEYPISYKKHTKVSFDSSKLSRSLEYLLRPGPCEKKTKYTGIAFRKLEVSSTNAYNLHICTGMPMLSETHAMLSLEAGAALLQAIRKLDIQKVEGLYKPGKQQPSRGSFVFTAETEEGIEVQVGSFPTTEVYDLRYTRARLPIDDRRASVAVHQAFLAETCSYAMKVCPAGEEPVMGLRFQPGRYIYDIESNRYSAELPLWDWRADGLAEIVCRVNAGHVLKAIRGLGNVIQFIFPFHPLDGLKYHSYNPIYINGDARTRFAILAQCGDVQEAMRIDAERDGVLHCPSNSSTG